MKLLNTKLEYNKNGAFIQIQELTSCDVAFMNAPSRSNWERFGTYTNESIDTITVNFKRGYNDLLDSIKVGTEIQLKWNNGAIAYAGKFIVSQKYNTKQSDGITNTYMVFEPTDDPISILGRGGEGGHVDDVELTDDTGTRSVVTGGVAEINLTGYAKKTELDKKLSLSGGTMDTYAQLSMHSGRIVDLAEPTGDTHAATKKYADTKVAKATGTIEFTMGVDADGVYIIK